MEMPPVQIVKHDSPPLPSANIFVDGVCIGVFVPNSKDSVTMLEEVLRIYNSALLEDR